LAATRGQVYRDQVVALEKACVPGLFGDCS